MMAEGGRSSLTIGEVLALLAPDFPDVTISKIRFLEGHGLVSPHRAKSDTGGSATRTSSNCGFVLIAQRDRYLPLKVIKDHLAAGTLQELVRPQPQVEIALAPDTTDDIDRPSARTTDVGPRSFFTRSELAEASGLTTADLDQLIEVKVITPDAAHRFTGADVQYPVPTRC